MHYPIKSIGNKRAATSLDIPTPPQSPNYTGTSQFVGTSPSGRVTVYVDPTLGGPGLQNAQRGRCHEYSGEEGKLWLS
jgi:hypothetical protein